MRERLEQISLDGYYYNGSYYIKRGFELFGKNAGNSIVIAILFFVISAAAGIIPLAGILITYPLTAGFMIVARELDKHGTFEINHFFEGFNNFGNLFVGYLLMAVFILLGLLALVIPGIYLSVSLVFVLPILALSDLKPMEAIKLSRKIIDQQWFMFFFLGLFIVFLNLVGALFLLVGLLVTVPVSYYILYAAFADIIAGKEATPEEITTPDPKMDYDIDQYFKDLDSGKV